MSLIAENIIYLRSRLHGAKLIAVSKTRSSAEIEQALATGQLVFGENKVQEAQQKFPMLRATYPKLELHLIGALQTNKAVAAVELFDVIQTIDRPAVADAVAAAIQKTGHRPRLYMQINIGHEPQKAGVMPEEAEDFLNYCRHECGLAIDGLMCIPPHLQDPTLFFQQMRRMADAWHLPHLSMGMSDDFETAIACGATEVRIGTAIFGERLTPVSV